MAGTPSRVFGIIFLILGFIILASGIGATIYGNEQQKENEERGLFEDQDEKEANQALATAGLAAIAMGILFAIVGAILLAVASGQSNKAHQLELAKLGESTVAPTSKESDAPRAQRETAEVNKRNIVIGVSVFLAILLVIVLLAGGDRLGITNVFDDDRSKVEIYNGSIENTIVVPMLGAQSMGSDHIVLATPPEGTVGASFSLVWMPQENTATLHFLIEIERNGTWETLVQNTVSSGDELRTDEAIGDMQLRMTVTPDGDAYAVQNQEFSIMAAYRIPA